jgi:hypothetical protein
VGDYLRVIRGLIDEPDNRAAERNQDRESGAQQDALPGAGNAFSECGHSVQRL